jgi:hypothetical protein
VIPLQQPGRLIIRTCGPGVERGRIGADDLALLLRATQAAVERIALVLLGDQGVRRGRWPVELERLTRLEVVEMGRGSVTVQLELRRDQPALPEMDMDVGARAIRAFANGVHWLEARQEVPPGWDAGVLMALRELSPVFRRGIESIEVGISGEASGRLSEPSVARIGRLVTQTVTNVRSVEGRLLMADFKESGPRCRVHPPVGPPIECTFDDAHRQAVLDALTRYVRVTGQAELESTTGRIKQLAIADIEVISWEGGEEVTYPFWEPSSVDDLARIQNVRPLERLEDLAAPIWESAEELERFLADVYAARTPRQKT